MTDPKPQPAPPSAGRIHPALALPLLGWLAGQRAVAESRRNESAPSAKKTN